MHDFDNLPWEYTELLLCRDVYHCLPSELDQEDWGRIQLHMAMMQAEVEAKK